MSEDDDVGGTPTIHVELLGGGHSAKEVGSSVSTVVTIAPLHTGTAGARTTRHSPEKVTRG